MEKKILAYYKKRIATLEARCTKNQVALLLYREEQRKKYAAMFWEVEKLKTYYIKHLTELHKLWPSKR